MPANSNDLPGMENQVPVQDKPTGSPNNNKGSPKKLVQQVFHPGLFMSNKKNDNPPTATSSVPWQRIPEQRKRIISPTSQTPTAKILKQTNKRQPNPVNNSYSKETTTNNSFTGLEIDVEELNGNTSNNNTTPRISKPPPIILYGIEDLKKLTELIEQAVSKDTYSYKVISKNELRISSRSVETYKLLIEHIRGARLIGHTFTRKEERAYRIVIKNLHHTTPKEAIIESIESTGNKVRGEIVFAKRRGTKEPLDTFFVNIEPSVNNKNVKTIKYIYNQKVSIEDPRKTTSIPQCMRCQQYGHTKNNCMRPFRCVKCAGGHKTSECTKTDRNSPATCALCLGNHPASYRGCGVYQEMLARKKNKKQFVTKQDKVNYIKSNDTQTHTQHDDQVTKGQPSLQAFPNNNHGRMLYSNVLKNIRYSNDDHHQPTQSYNKPQINITREETPTTNIIERMESLILKQSEELRSMLQQIGNLIGLVTMLISKIQP